MNCTEVRSYLESAAAKKTPPSEQPAEVTEHARHCPGCARLLGEDTELVRLLSLMRETTPAVSPSLDSAILTNFRERATRRSTPIRFFNPASSALTMLWRGAAAAAILATVAGLLIYRHVTLAAETIQPPPPVAVIQPPHPAITHAVIAKAAAAPKRNSPSHHAKQTEDARTAPPAPAEARSAFPPGFTGLMYCDPLSCGEPMEVIRMQLPRLPAGPTRSSPRTNDIVYADVLVGSDGVARGYRIVQ